LNVEHTFDWTIRNNERRLPMLALGTGGIVALGIVLAILVVLFIVVLGKARRSP
jgi:hypothetical protein